MTITIETPPTILAEGFRFTECPRWRDGWLYFSDMHGRTVHRIDEAGTLETVCRVEARPGGIGFLPGGDMLIVAMDEARILRRSGDRLEPYADMASAAATGVNDMVVSREGRAYAGKYCHDIPPPREPLLFVDENGAWREAGEPLDVANGLVLTANGKRLIVAESAASRLSVFDLAADGTPTNRRIFADLPEGHYPDGICGDAEDGIWVTCCLGPGLVRVEEGGRITHFIPMAGDRFPYACALGGADGRTLFICSAGPFDPAVMEQGRTGRIETIRAPYAGSGIP
ncbi:SMP-30/gluconolactonase/LRE family protein [Flavisphingomonas formosensis]|uniref:SMP-30/gluconolactonase/LRE family protein n=1 Tax=Flavisphingomonas formosensis TaxID=861534 RepID=UPI0012F9CCB1|nr:SMP-30/gluconolactonase/LRE family protein [Sphingomonas formosensis]